MMTAPSGAQSDPRLDHARQVIRTEAEALTEVASRLGASFLAAVDTIFRCTGRVCLTGTGKSADVAQKIAGTFNSTGTRAYLLDATRAVHGDLGMVAPNDVVLALSHSGESEEVVRILRPLRQLASALIGLTSNPKGTLAREADIAIVLGPLTEADPLGLAPSTSTTAMIAVGDALAFVLSRQRAFNHDDFARFHPAGSLGRKLMRVEAIMRRGDELRIAPATWTVRQVFAQSVGRTRRSGAVMLVDERGRLVGIFTDSDLARLFEQRRDHLLDEPIFRVMTPRPLTIRAGSRLLDALDILRTRKISELPVVDEEQRPVGLIDITDVLGLVPEAASDADSRAAA